MNRKEKYESPWMERTLVELEDGFCAGSVVTPNNNKVETTGHELNKIDLNSDGFEWNQTDDGKNGWLQ